MTFAGIWSERWPIPRAWRALSMTRSGRWRMPLASSRAGTPSRMRPSRIRTAGPPALRTPVWPMPTRVCRLLTRSRVWGATIPARAAAARSSRSAAWTEGLSDPLCRACCEESARQTGAIRSFADPFSLATLTVHLDLQRRAQPLGQQVDRVGIYDVRGVDAVFDAGFQEPGDELAPVTGHALELERGRTIADLLHLRPAQVVAQLGIADQQHRQDHACASSQLHEPLESGQRLVVQLMGLVDDQHHGMLVLAHEVAQLALTPFGLLGDLDLAAVAGRQVVEHGLDQRWQRRAALIDRQ